MSFNGSFFKSVSDDDGLQKLEAVTGGGGQRKEITGSDNERPLVFDNIKLEIVTDNAFISCRWNNDNILQ